MVFVRVLKRLASRMSKTKLVLTEVAAYKEEGGAMSDRINRSCYPATPQKSQSCV